jgi:hypothetical protein
MPLSRHRRTVSDANINKNVNWLGSRGVWTWYVSLLLLMWAVSSALLQLLLPGGGGGGAGGSGGTGGGGSASSSSSSHGNGGARYAWTAVHWLHGAASYWLLHWTKGSPCAEDQGRFDQLTFWEQMDNETYGTSTRKFFTLVPVATLALAAHGGGLLSAALARGGGGGAGGGAGGAAAAAAAELETARLLLGVNVAVAAVLLVAKLPAMHRVRIFGIGRW